MQPRRGEIDDDRDQDDEVARDGEAPHRTDRGDRVGDGAQIRTRKPLTAATQADRRQPAAEEGAGLTVAHRGVPSKRYQRPFHQPHAMGSGTPPR